MENIKLGTKMYIICFLMVLTLIGTAIVAIYVQRESSDRNKKSFEMNIQREYERNLQYQVDSIESFLDQIYHLYETNTYTLAEAKVIAVNTIGSIKYGDSGNFIVYTYDGDVVSSPDKSLIGTNVLGKVDREGKAYIKEIIAVGHNKEGGFSDYVLSSSGNSDEAGNKVYSRAYEKLKWIITTEVNMKEFNDVIAENAVKMDHELRHNMKVIITQMVLFFVVIAIVVVLITIDLIRSFKFLSKYIEIMATGRFDLEIPKKYLTRKCEIGTIFKALELMKRSIKQLITQVSIEINEIYRYVEEVDHEFQELSSSIEEVSATTEEISAGIEETAASAEEINATSVQIESNVSVIAEQSKEGIKVIDQIKKKADQMKLGVQDTEAKSMNMYKIISTNLNEAVEQAKIVSKINLLTDTIIDITCHNNLLDLNESIEAARAGEHGKGFAVVAEEIRKLAEESKTAVNQIIDVTEKVHDAVDHLASSADVILKFISEDVVKDYIYFFEVATEYEKDARYFYSAEEYSEKASEDTLQSVEAIVKVIQEVSISASEGAEGTNGIAKKTIDVMNEVQRVINIVHETKECATRLVGEIAVFKIEEDREKSGII